MWDQKGPPMGPYDPYAPYGFRPREDDEIAVVVIPDHDLHGDHPRLPLRWLNAAADKISKALRTR
jgi:hypothetical protein